MPELDTEGEEGQNARQALRIGLAARDILHVSILAVHEQDVELSSGM